MASSLSSRNTIAVNKIITIQQAATKSENLREQRKTIVIAGGCFDLLHIGHIQFLKAAKKQGDVLMLLLESDKAVEKLKGEKRPISKQADRAEVLASLEMVDSVVLLPHPLDDHDYDSLVLKLKPAIIATTKNDPAIVHKKRQAALINANVVTVIDRIDNQSSSTYIKVLEEHFNL